MLVIGLGTGHCGLNLLTEILSQQVGASVTHEEPPLLPWVRRPEFPGVRERISRWKSQRTGSLIGDCAHFYLPYAEEALAADPDLRIVCLERPAEEVIAAFCRQLDRTAPFPTNHWAKTPAPGWYHDPLWTQTFPQYDTPDRLHGLRLYCDEYASTIRDIADCLRGKKRGHSTFLAHPDAICSQKQNVPFSPLWGEVLKRGGTSRLPIGQNIDCHRLELSNFLGSGESLPTFMNRLTMNALRGFSM